MMSSLSVVLILMSLLVLSSVMRVPHSAAVHTHTYIVDQQLEWAKISQSINQLINQTTNKQHTKSRKSTAWKTSSNRLPINSKHAHAPTNGEKLRPCIDNKTRQCNRRLHFVRAVHSRHPLPADRRCGLSSTCRRRTKHRQHAQNWIQLQAGL